MRYLGILPIIWACAGEKKQNTVVGEEDTITEDTVDTGDTVEEKFAPAISITSHISGVQIIEGAVESFLAQVTDQDTDLTDVRVRWYVNDEVVCDWVQADASGESACDIVFQEGDSVVSVVAEDVDALEGSAEISVDILLTEVPTVELLTPLPNTRYYFDLPIEFSALIADGEDVSEDLIVTWTSNIDGDILMDNITQGDGAYSAFGSLSEGQHVISVLVEDTSGKSATSDVTIDVGPTNNAPTCSIVLPVANTVFGTADTVQLEAMVQDDDIDSTLLSVEWSSDIEGVLGTGMADANGLAALSYTNLSANQHNISLLVMDDLGATCTATVSVLVGNAPTVTISSPIDSMVFSVGDTIDFMASASDSEDIVTDLALEWSSDIDGVLYTGTPDVQGLSVFSSNTLQAGVHQIAIQTTDTMGLTGQDSVSIRVNTPPVLGSITLSPEPVFATDDLVVVAVSSDADGDALSTTYAWYENGVLTAFTGDTISASELQAGEEWTVQVLVNDGYIDSNIMESSIVVSSTPPMVSGASITPSTAYNDSVLVCAATVSDIDQAIIPSYTWEINGNIVSNTTDTLDLSTVTAIPTDTVVCTVTAEDDFALVASDSVSIILSNRAPVLSNVQIDPNASVYTNSTLLCSADIQDDDGENLSATYEWIVNGNTVSTQADITLDNALVSPADTVECVVRVTDGYGSSVSSSTSVTVLNSDPVIDSISLSPVNPLLTDTAVCTAFATDADGDTPTLALAWTNQNSGVAYPATTTSASSITLDISAITISPNDVLVCTVSATDAQGSTVSMSESVTVANTPPTVDSVAISPTTNVTTSSLVTCTATASDFTDGNVPVTYAWTTSNGATATGSTWQLDSNTVSPMDSITCVATATDSGGLSDSATSSPVTISNSAPTISTVAISPNSNVVTGTTLTCSATGTDPDEGTILPTYAWTVNGVQIASGATYTVNASNTNVGDSVVCVATVTDMYGASVSDSGSVVVTNTPPTVGNTSITPATGYNDGTFYCTTTVTDPDETITPTYSWSVGGNTLASGNPFVSSSAVVSPNDVLRCTATGTDTSGATDSQTATLTIGNRAPSDPTISITWSGPDAEPMEGDDLTCWAASSVDPDGSSVSYSYSWTSSAGDSVVGNIVSGSLTVSNDDWTCFAVASDGSLASAVVDDTITIGSMCGLTDCDVNLDLGGGQSIDLVLIPAGTFTMGSPSTEKGRFSDEVQHQVTLTHNFYAMTTEVTQAMFLQVMGYNSHTGKATSDSTGTFGVGDNYPTYWVNWHMAAAFANAVTARHNSVNGTNLQSCYSCSGNSTNVSCSQAVSPYSCTGYRLLTEAEWEYAARAGTTTAYWTPNGGGDLPAIYNSNSFYLTDSFDLRQYAWYTASNIPNGSKQVASLLPNDFRLYDMSGNLWEWVHDYSAAYSTNPATNPVQTTGTNRGLRGGFWYGVVANERSARRFNQTPTTRAEGYGFRIGILE